MSSQDDWFVQDSSGGPMQLRHLDPLDMSRISTIQQSYATGWVDDGHGGQQYLRHGKIQEVTQEDGEPLSPLVLSDHDEPPNTPPPAPKMAIYRLPENIILSSNEIPAFGEMEHSLVIEMLETIRVVTQFELYDLIHSSRHYGPDSSILICMMELLWWILLDISGIFRDHRNLSFYEWSFATIHWHQKYYSRLLSLQRTLRRLRGVLNFLISPLPQRTLRIMHKLKEHYKKLADLRIKFVRAFSRVKTCQDDICRSDYVPMSRQDVEDYRIWAMLYRMRVFTITSEDI
ncbi:hypothetical protein C8J56DRAFT_981932 [Mycena floridula]|nr:hypothetical protein C8J56DRAFT_981932 [Mycena floridula]